MRHLNKLLTIVLMLVVANAMSQVSFAPTTITTFGTTGANAYNIANGDLNGDGKQDLVIADFSRGEIDVALGLGDGSFGTPQVYEVMVGYNAQPIGLELQDYNKDGKLDVAVASRRGQRLSIMLGNGTGNLAAPIHHFIDWQTGVLVAGHGALLSDLASGDFNGDTKLDMVVVDEAFQLAAIFLGNGDGTFSISAVLSTGVTNYTVITGDFNKDGKLDIAMTNSNVIGNGSVSVFNGNGNGTFNPRTIFDTGNRYAHSLRTGDLNSDGNLDLVVANSGSLFDLGDFTVLLGNGAGGFAISNSYSLNNYPTDAYLEDFNLDGHLDLAARHDGGISILPGDGTGALGSPYTFNSTGNNFIGSRLIAADFNGDGRPDIASAIARFYGITINTTGLSCIPISQQNALVNFYNSTGGASWTDKTNWLKPVEDTWFGVDVTACNVTSLALPSNNVVGAIPAGLSGLTGLKVLDLSNNQVTGNLPASMGSNVNLTNIRLNGNQLTSIPAFASTLITELKVENNKLTFEDLEPNIGKAGFTYSPQADLPGGTMLAAAGGELTIPFTTPGSANVYQWKKDGVIIPGANAATYYKNSITVADAGDYTVEVTNTIVTGLTLTSEVFAVTVRDVPKIFSFSPMSGPPGTIVTIEGENFTAFNGQNNYAHFNFQYGVVINASPTRLRVVVPEFASTNLITLQGDNTVVSADPFTVTTCSGVDAGDRAALEALYNSTDGANWTNKTNWLTADVSTWYGVTVAGCRVQSVNLFYNNLAGPIPVEIGNLDALVTLQLGANRLDGTLIPELANLTNLTGLDLSHDWFNPPFLSGSIPAFIGDLEFLINLNLSDNVLTGPIPIELTNLKYLQKLWLRNNQLTGTIPPEIGNLKTLQELDLGKNGLTGIIPPEIGDLSSLYTLDLTGDPYKAGFFTGTFPDWLSKLNLQTIRLGDNQLTGEVPAFYFPGGYEINLASNKFTGAFPASYAHFENIQLTNNEFTDLPLITNAYQLYVGGNKLTFADLENNTIVSGGWYQQAPQPNLPGDTLYIPAGDPITMSATTDGAFNTYQWVKNNVGIAGATSSTFNIPATTAADAGNYVLEVRNTKATGLVISTDPFVVKIVGTCATPPIVVGGESCENSVVELIASGGIDGQYRWYTTPSGGTPIQSQFNGRFITPQLTVTTTYYVAFAYGSCESARTAVTATVRSCPNPFQGLIWAKNFGGAGAYSAAAKAARDAAGNQYIVGYFNNTVDFDPGAGVFELTAGPAGSDIYVQKLNPEGEFIWAVSFGDPDTYYESASNIDVDLNGNVAVVGSYYAGTIDFDPGSGVANIASTGYTDGYILKLNADGSFAWARALQPNATSHAWVNSVEFDNSGNVVFGGGISGTVDFDLGAGVNYLNGFSGYVFKLDAAGSLAWLKTKSLNVSSIHHLTSDEYLVTGSGGNDLVLEKLSSAGDVVWSKYHAGLYSAVGVKTDSQGNIYTGGAFVRKFDSSGNLLWVRGTAGVMLDFDIDESDNIITVGRFQNYGDFDPGPGVYTMSSMILNGAGFIVKLNSDGYFLWAKKLDGIGHYYYWTYVNDVITGSNGDIYLYGIFGNVKDFDPDACTYNITAIGEFDSFVVKLGTSATIFPPPTTTDGSRCSFGSVTLAASGATNGEYRWYNESTGGAAIAGEVNSTYVTPTLLGTKNYFVSINNGSCESTRTRVIATVGNPAQPLTTNATSCGEAAIDLIASGAVTGSEYRWYDVISGGSSFNSTNTYTTPILTATKSYYVSIFNSSGSCESARTEAIASVTNVSPPTAAGSTACEGLSVTLTASGGSAGQFRWYEVATGGSPASGFTNNTFSTLPLSSTTSYFVSIQDGNCESGRVSVEATIVPKPAVPGVTVPSSSCGPSTFNLAATGGSDGQYRWYTSATAGSPIGSEVNGQYTTPMWTSSTTCFVSINNGTCESDRVAINATIVNVPTAPAVTDNSRCRAGQVTLSASGPASSVYRWYTTNTAGTAIPGQASNSMTTPDITGTTTYYVSIVNGLCESSRVAITAVVNSCNSAPTIAAEGLSTPIEGTVSVNLLPLISDEDQNLDLSTLKILIQPASGARASITASGELVIDYAGITFSGKDSITIEVCDTDGICTTKEITIDVFGDVVIYNAVSPNGDNLNDILLIQYIDAIPDTRSNKVTIYNRWGDAVWEGSNYDNKTVVFAGLNRDNNPLPPGSYFYKITFDEGNKEPMTGFLSLRK